MSIHRQLAAANYEPQRKNAFKVEFTNAPTMGDELWLSLEEFPFPKDSSAAHEIRWGNSAVHYAGSQETFGPVTLTVREWVDRSVASKFLEWRRLAYNEAKGTIGWARSYKKNGFLYLFPSGDANNNTTSLETVSTTTNARKKIGLYGCWVKGFDMGTFSQNNQGEQVLLNIELCIDFVDYHDGFGAAASPEGAR